MKTSEHSTAIVKGLNKILEVISSTEDQTFKTDLLLNYRSYCSRLENCIDCGEKDIIFRILLAERPMTDEEVEFVSNKIAPNFRDNITLN